MQYSEFEEKMRKEGTDLGITFLEEQLQNFYQYMHCIQEWNQKMNLTAIESEADMITKHFIDSLTIMQEIGEDKKIADIGTGAGLPGIPLKIMLKNTSFVLVDSLQKRIQFIQQQVIPILQLQEIEAIHGRAEDVAKLSKYREQFDVVTSRAVAALPTLVEYLLPFVAIGGKCICMKGPKWKEELTQAEEAIEQLGGKLEKVIPFVLGQDKMERNIVVIRKERATPQQFPRKAGMPQKNPILKKN